MTVPVKKRVRRLAPVSPTNTVVNLLSNYVAEPLQSRSRKASLNKLLKLHSLPDYGNFRHLALPSITTLPRQMGRPMIPLTPKQFMLPLIEFLSTELKSFEWVSLLISLPKLQNLTFFEDISETANTIWAVQDIQAHFPTVEGSHTHDPLSRTIVLQSLGEAGKPKSSIELIVDLVFETAMIDLYLNYPEHYQGVVGRRLAYIQVQIFLNIASAFYSNLQRYQPFSRVITPTHTIQLSADTSPLIADEFIRLENLNASAIADCNKTLNFEPNDVSLYI